MLATVTGGQDAPPVASGRRPVRLENAPGRPENAPGRLSAFVGLAGELEAAAAAAPTASTSSALVPVIDVAFAVLAMTVPIAMLVFMTLGTTARLALAVWAGAAVAHAMFVGHNANHERDTPAPNELRDDVSA